MKTDSQQLRKRIIHRGAPLAIGVFVGVALAGIFFWGLSRTTAATPISSLRLNLKQFPFINPLLLCNVDSKNLNRDTTLEGKIKSLIKVHVASGKAENMSVYVINYSAGTWSGVNETEQYDPASMLKVPVMMAVYEEAEKDPTFLSREVSFQGTDQNSGEYFKSKDDIKAGQTYTVDQLVNSMIVNSDNTALVLLQNYLGTSVLNTVYTDLGLAVPAQGGMGVEYLSAKSYAFFFRVLYNATYLDRSYSEKALELLSKPDIPGIRNGVPAYVPVAQKFGERSVFDSAGNLQDRELHDCGIVYKQDSPYLLCVMSRGKDFDVLAKNITDVSALVYQNIGAK